MTTCNLKDGNEKKTDGCQQITRQMSSFLKKEGGAFLHTPPLPKLNEFSDDYTSPLVVRDLRATFTYLPRFYAMIDFV
jgi:hypothetical protein